MASSNVIGFPQAPRPIPGQVASPSARAGIVAYLDVRTLDQARLLALLRDAAVAGVIDARPVSVFERPAFRHREVVSHLFDNGIAYVEMMMLAIWPASERGLGIFDVPRAMPRIEDVLARGLTLCLHDERARGEGWLAETRRLARHARGYVADLHPRALAPATEAERPVLGLA